MTESVNLLSRNISQSSASKVSVETRMATSSLRFATSWDDLVATTKADDIELVLWKRNHFASCVATETSAAAAFEILIGERKNVLTNLNDILKTSNWPDTLQSLVRQDVQGFLNAAEARVPGSHYRLRLQAVSNDACRKFHQDRTFQRLIITYRGKGTVWRYAESTAEHEATEMECVLLRGKRSERDTQIEHKSPIFTEGHPPRLVMVIDIIPPGFVP